MAVVEAAGIETGEARAQLGGDELLVVSEYMCVHKGHIVGYLYFGNVVICEGFFAYCLQRGGQCELASKVSFVESLLADGLEAGRQVDKPQLGTAEGVVGDVGYLRIGEVNAFESRHVLDGAPVVGIEFAREPQKLHRGERVDQIECLYAQGAWCGEVYGHHLALGSVECDVAHGHYLTVVVDVAEMLVGKGDGMFALVQNEIMGVVRLGCGIGIIAVQGVVVEGHNLAVILSIGVEVGSEAVGEYGAPGSAKLDGEGLRCGAAHLAHGARSHSVGYGPGIVGIVGHFGQFDAITLGDDGAQLFVYGCHGTVEPSQDEGYGE